MKIIGIENKKQQPSDWESMDDYFYVFALKYSHEQISKEMTDAATKKKPAQGMFAVGSTDNEYLDNI